MAVEWALRLQMICGCMNLVCFLILSLFFLLLILLSLDSEAPIVDSVREDLLKMLDIDRFFPDISFVADETKIKAHKCILASRSSYFERY